MGYKAKKMAVYYRLCQEIEAVTLKKLIDLLGEEYSKRSLRRWLAEMVKEGLVDKQGAKRGTRYQAIQSTPTHATELKQCFSTESQKIIDRVRRPVYEREPVTYADHWFEAYVPNKSFYIPSKLRLKLYQAGRRSKLDDPAGTYAQQIFNRLLIDLSYNSSRLEGNTYSLLDTQKLVLEGKSAEGKLDQETVMILNHKEAIRYLVDTAARLKVSKETVCTLHFLLSDGLLEAADAGKVRNHGVRIGGSTYIPFEDPRQLQVRLDRIIEKSALIEDPYEQSFFLLIYLSYLQAFSDVNKRTARLSANIPLIQKNLVPLSFNDVEKDDYNSAIIAIYELQDIRPFLDLYVFSYLRTCIMYDSTVRTLGFDEIRVRYRQQRRAVVREVIVNLLKGDAIKDYVLSQALALVKKEDREAFFEDAMEDLKEMDSSRLAGLGITSEQLTAWMKLFKAGA